MPRTFGAPAVLVAPPHVFDAGSKIPPVPAGQPPVGHTIIRDPVQTALCPPVAVGTPVRLVAVQLSCVETEVGRRTTRAARATTGRP
jgi:hypothetical protein